MRKTTRERRRPVRRSAAARAALAAVGPLALAFLAAGQAPPDEPEPLAALGFEVTSGAAPGYVEDRVCGMCHPDLYRSYREVGMARSFYRPAPEKDIEDFEENTYLHEPSQRHYEMVREGDRLLFRRHQLDAEGRPIHVVEQPVDWILGSGNHSRTYLYRTPGGELFQLPLAWYTQEQRWGMAPGFDRPDHQGLSRRVRRECTFCHNAYPDVPAGSDVHGAPQTFPADLPQGTGCQRCHGPGAAHVALAFGGEPDREALRGAIINPRRLPPRLRDDVCYECHMQPSVALSGIRRFGRPDYSFRPGQPLADYLVQMDVVEEGTGRGERFEINHHPYRLERSRCFAESDGGLSCLTCHDPHRKVPAAERAAHYRQACLGCHEADACRLEEMAGEGAAAGHGSPGGGASGGLAGEAMPRPGAAVDPGDCVSCHMPKRRTQDVIHVVMTDHLIRRVPGGPELLAPLAEREPVLLDVEFLHPERAPEGALGEVYRAAAVSRAHGGRYPPAVDHLERKLGEVRPPELEPYLDLAEGQLEQQRPAAAEATLRDLLRRFPGHPEARYWLAFALSGQDRHDEAIRLLEELAAEHPERVEARFNLGRMLARRKRYEEAAGHYEKALELRPRMAVAWAHLGLARAAQGRRDDAIAAFRRLLENEPANTGGYLLLAEALLAADRRAEALRYLRHGARVASESDEVAAALARVTGATP